MIEKIQNLIEDNTSMEITRQQVIMLLAVLGAVLLLIIFMMIKSATGVKSDPEGYVPPKSNSSAPMHVSGGK